MWTLLAWAAIVLHVAYLTYQTFGGLLALNNHLWLIPHVGCVIWGVGIVVIQGNCPITRLEKWFWTQGGQTPYEGSFLDHYLFGTLLPDGSQALVYGLHLVVIIAIYVLVARRWRETGRRQTEPESVTTSTPTE